MIYQNGERWHRDGLWNVWRSL